MIDWEWLLKRSRPVFDGFVRLEPKKWGSLGTTLELAAETGKLARAITVFEGYRHGRRSRHDLADELSDILFVLCRFIYDNNLQMSGSLPYELFDGPESVIFRMNYSIQKMYYDLCGGEGLDLSSHIDGVAAGVRWLAEYYKIDLKLAHEEEMRLASDYQRIFFSSNGIKKTGNKLDKLFRKVSWYLAMRRHVKVLNSH